MTIDNAEYGVITYDENGKKKTTYLFSTLERCQKASEKVPGSLVVRLGGNHKTKSFEVPKKQVESQLSFNVHVDESGNRETPGEVIDRLIEDDFLVVDGEVYELISHELIRAGYQKGSRPPVYILQDIAMRYNDIVPEDFAAAVAKHCKISKPSVGRDNRHQASLFKSNAEKDAWYDTPAGIAWVKENPIPSIFNLPTPEYMHRRG